MFCSIGCFCLSVLMYHMLILFISVFVSYVDSVYLCFCTIDCFYLSVFLFHTFFLFICVFVLHVDSVYLCFAP